MASPAVLMTDPRHFAIRGGANPHTRNPDDSLKTVETETAIAQWHDYVDMLLDGGVDVYVVDGTPETTGMVFAANAGFLRGRLDDVPSREKFFYVSHFTPAHRQPESPIFSAFMKRFGFPVVDYPESLTFEGEADAFPVGRGDELEWIFTHGFRSDERVGDWLEKDVVEEPFHTLRLTDPRFYHGDCLICDLGGPLLVWRGGLDEDDVASLEDSVGDRIIWLDDEDAEAFVGNSFYVETDDDRLLYAPAAIGDDISEKIEATGVTVVSVDISEFFGKGGGGPKCMVFNLGRVDPDEEGVDDAVRAFRAARHVTALRADGHFEYD